MKQNVAIRNCRTLGEFHKCVELQREIWGEEDLEVEPVTSFVVAAHTGGQVIGAFIGERLVGYTLALVGVRGIIPYLHSHMTGVQAAHRDRGLGRALKLFQREDALSRRFKLIAWTFDPLEVRNAHFNLNRLGAVCRSYLPNLYGVTTSPLHRSLPTDRLLAEWELESPRVVAAVAQANEDSIAEDATASVRLPGELQVWQQQGDPRVADVQAAVRGEFLKWFGEGYVATSIEVTAQSATYRLTLEGKLTKGGSPQ